VRNKRNPFLARLISSVEQPSIHQDIQQMGMFVRIGDSEPQYEFAPPPPFRGGLRQSGYLPLLPIHKTPGYDMSRLPTLPTTPFRLK
jgi:hypothetical protein